LKPFNVAEMSYGEAEIYGLREELIRLRDEDLSSGEFMRAVVLSHTIALLGKVAEMFNGQTET
jgi:hypothetical protein